ncbi:MULTISPECIES: hypothetical protein [unclassified Pseudomonas]|uniref:hypothetical protein n=1 Tax=unclassified Pseudomonas TaxID=196821 RepID=UPI000C869158|nr:MULTISPECIES: hypothetical protein [unclassified Pseudomonas]PMV89768.1 hypothetical protein C1X55_32975 [Pseudomonas sp. GW460-C8]PMW09453.1 hypothetical protein C1X40_33055 [Pseudomonas sp. GW456-11-11-14-TSB2]PMW11122.1 hypothetical protein C1X53_32465 [Pseudomonas sp. GW456-E6]PMW27448.1 hypothetical protein C1X45_33055 [Pseudomonas sp. GW460-7]PMW27557.1 hypothetical protein C1X48_33865 [Pseudomonas sp. FW305-3-2-15-A-R2A1]
MKLLYWANRTLWLIGQPSAALALAAFVFVWFKIGYIGLLAVVPSILLLLVAIVYCQVLKRFYRRGAKAVDPRRAGSGLS